MRKFTTLEKLVDLFSFLIIFDCNNLIFLFMSSSSKTVTLLAIWYHLQLFGFNEIFLVLDFVLKIAPQQGQRTLAMVRNMLHMEHLFCPISYLEPFGTLSPLNSSQIPLQQYPINGHQS